VPTFWYSIRGQEFPYHVPFRTPLRSLDAWSRARIAEKCAEEYHEQRGGDSGRWPIVIELLADASGPVVSRHSVERASAPVFVASEETAA